MTTLSPTERKGEIAAVRAKLKSKVGASDALNNAIARALDEAGIRTDPSLKHGFVLAIPEELSDNLNQVILPGGTNCS